MNRLVGKIVIALAAMIVLPPVAILVINSSPFDESLHPEAARFLNQQPAVPIADGDNAYYPWMGIYSAADKDPDAVGRELIERFNAAQRSGEKLPAEAGLEGGILASTLEVQVLETCDRSPDVNCLQVIEENRARIEQLAARHQPYLHRYEMLLGRAGFHETAMADFRAPLVPNVLPLERLFIASAYLEKRERPEDFLAALDRDLGFRRMVLTDAESLVAKIQSARAVRFVAKVLAEYAAIYELSQAQAEHLGRLLTPLAQEELDISEAFAHEFRMMAKVVFDYANGRGREGLHGASGFGESMRRRLTQPNATINRVYGTLFRDLMRVSAMSTPDFRKMTAQIESEEARAAVANRSWSPYNYGGRRILSIAIPDLLTPIRTMHDLQDELDRTSSHFRLKTVGGGMNGV